MPIPIQKYPLPPPPPELNPLPVKKCGLANASPNTVITMPPSPFPPTFFATTLFAVRICENTLINSFGIFGFGQESNINGTSKDEGIQVQFGFEPLENLENVNDGEKEDEEMKFEKKVLSEMVASFDCSNEGIVLCSWLDPATKMPNSLSSKIEKDSLIDVNLKAIAKSVKAICGQIENLLKMDNERIGQGVFAIPDDWNIAQRREFMGALKSIAGFEKIKLLNVQTAVVLGFCRQNQFYKMEKHRLLWLIKSSHRSLEMSIVQIQQNKLAFLAKNDFKPLGEDFDADNLPLEAFRQHFCATSFAVCQLILLGNFRIKEIELTIQNEFGLNKNQIHAIGLDESTLCIKGCFHYAEHNFNSSAIDKHSSIHICELLRRPICCQYLEAHSQTMLFPKFSKYPCQKRITFYSALNAQQTFQMKFYELDETSKIKDFNSSDQPHHLVHKICATMLNDDSRTFGKTFLRFRLEIDSNGILHVAIEESGRESLMDESMK